MSNFYTYETDLIRSFIFRENNSNYRTHLTRKYREHFVREIFDAIGNLLFERKKKETKGREKSWRGGRSPCGFFRAINSNRGNGLNKKKKENKNACQRVLIFKTLYPKKKIIITQRCGLSTILWSTKFYVGRWINKFFYTFNVSRWTTYIHTYIHIICFISYPRANAISLDMKIIFSKLSIHFERNSFPKDNYNTVDSFSWNLHSRRVMV